MNIRMKPRIAPERLASALFAAFPVLVAVVIVAVSGTARAAGGEETAPWAKPWDIQTESEFLHDRIEEPWNHFLLDGQDGFVSGREFYQATGEVSPFLWASHPFLHYGSDRAWQTDSAALAVHVLAGDEIGETFGPKADASGDEEDATPLADGDVTWAPISELRLHAGIDQNQPYASHSRVFRAGLAGPNGGDNLSWYGENLPPKSQVSLGGAYDHRGATMAAQFNQGWWWTESPVSGMVYPWQGFNADFLYKAGDDFELSLVEQRWDSPLDQAFYHAHWRRSEIDMGFVGSSEGDWVWRLDVGYQRREMDSDSLFKSFLEQTYPTRFRYRQIWNAPDSMPVQMVSSGSMGFRERLIHVQHTSEFREKWDSHQVRQILKGYYRHPMTGYHAPTEAFIEDTAWSASSHPGENPRGWSGELEYKEKRKAFEAGVSGNYAMEWETPVFQTAGVDTVYDALIRHGSYEGSNYLLENATGRVFAGGAVAGKGFWKAQAGWREFFGKAADSMEFRPSRGWVGGGGGYAFPSDLRLEVSASYLGEKEVRGWGPVFKVPSHFENNLTLEQSLLHDKMKLSLSALHAFGEDIREQPNGNPLRFRVIVGVTGTIY